MSWWTLRQSAKVFPSDRSFSGCGLTKFRSRDCFNSSRILWDGIFAAMLFSIAELSLLFPSFINYAFHSLARWSLELDLETGSSVRVGDKGLLFKPCVKLNYNWFLLSSFPAPCIGVSFCSWRAPLAVPVKSYSETVVTHSCVNLNLLAQQSQFSPKPQNMGLSYMIITMYSTLVSSIFFDHSCSWNKWVMEWLHTMFKFCVLWSRYTLRNSRNRL